MGVGTKQSTSWRLSGGRNDPHTQSTLLLPTGSNESQGGITGPSHGWDYGDTGKAHSQWQNWDPWPGPFAPRGCPPSRDPPGPQRILRY